MKRLCLAAMLAASMAFGAMAAPPDYDERPAKVEPYREGWNYDRRLVDITMRDGVKLHTVFLVPKGARNAPILLTRTPYDAEKLTSNVHSGNLIAALDGYDNAADIIVAGGYIRVIQDVRGKYKSGGGYVMNRPLVGSGLNPTQVDDATDTWDTIDWLVKNLPESNGRVGTLGISYDGYEPLVALVNPHPALKVSVPMNPMVDGWRGDDWFHNGAFRQMNADYIWEQVATTDNSDPFWWNSRDIYDAFMRAGSAGAFGRIHGLDQIGFWRKLTEHPAYDTFWQAQAMDKILAAQPLKVPVMLVHSLWDQEDIYGAPAVYAALKPKDTAGDMVFLTLGPWHHGQEIDDGTHSGNISWDQDAAKWWRWHVLAPFLAHYLKDEPMDVAPVTAFQSGVNEWRRLNAWPERPAAARLYLKPGMSLGFSPAEGAAETADYVSDPAHPVTFVPRPVRPTGYDDDHWTDWLTTDQRNAAARPDVLTFTSEVLTAPVTIAGQPVVHLSASTSGTDSDWVVKLIDVYPDETPVRRDMGGYQFAVGMDIFRGRYRQSLSDPKPITPNAPLAYSFALPPANHVFLPGHRIMVQVQSSWFPLYDRNPQTFTPNIFFAKPQDYVKATQKVVIAGPSESYIELPLVN
ncbi:CocE/NonD family hydrolase [Phenylobacterium montanum]|uniref:CocE/NonD family hydrolase n=1 Tax=Phenylobacterium montanum TaxID=2823693 RepID=A0A975G2P0_9CAUL|nr:CocE/NonD family hydrolase [Caulobacter sp. S6]